MVITENIEQFYLRKMNWMPENLKKEIGHFNVFRAADFVGKHARAIPFSRKDFYKITLIIGRNRYSYADKVVDINAPALLFTNPMIPYKCERLDDDQQGYFCIFTEAFFSQFGNIKEYPVFAPQAMPIYFPNADEVPVLRALFEQLFTELGSEYTFKYDVIRSQVLQLIHSAMKMTPAEPAPASGKNANTRISSLFVELLERQFPIDAPHQRMRLRTPADFSTHLSVHINHLNRALRAITGKTTSQIIAERVLQEAGILLKHTDWNVSEIGYALGFEEPSHFISFFRKHTGLTPGHYRK